MSKLECVKKIFVMLWENRLNMRVDPLLFYEFQLARFQDQSGVEGREYLKGHLSLRPLKDIVISGQLRMYNLAVVFN